MASNQNPVRVIEINEGPKIPFEQRNCKLVFGDDDLSIRCDNRQRDWPVHEDICVDDNGNLKLGLGKYYIAQVDIPARDYIEVPDEGGDGQEQTRREPVPLDMSNVTLTLWSTEGTPINTEEE